MSDRDTIVFQIAQALEPLGVPLQAPGACLNNMQWIARSGSKIYALRPYNFFVPRKTPKTTTALSVDERRARASDGWFPTIFVFSFRKSLTFELKV